MLKCGICEKGFECEHTNLIRKGELVDGTPTPCDHCKNCFYDWGQCPDKHGYQCPDCEKLYQMFNP